MNWSDIGLTFVRNFLYGGLLLGCLAVILQYISTELAGHISGWLPVSLSFVVVMTYLVTKDRQKAGKTTFTALVGGLMWCVYALSIGMILTYTEWDFTTAFCCNLVGYLLLTGVLIYSLRDHYFPEVENRSSISLLRF